MAFEFDVNGSGRKRVNNIGFIMASFDEHGLMKRVQTNMREKPGEFWSWL